ncbi:MAG TPA: ribbon-helix-helix domain-containing protein [Candidatus Acidoferrales bacterium]|nr:ribbon-helix-helix domain-containing protein [Candidatus Acidoferrales bacterium]
MKKIRTVFYIDEADRKALERLSAKTGAPLAELLRRAVTLYLKHQEKQ